MQLQGKQSNQNVFIQGSQPNVQTVSADSQFNTQVGPRIVV